MGENIKITEQQSSADKLREQIRHTESDITETVHTLEHRLSPRYIGQRGGLKAKLAAWRGTAKLLELAQRRSVQVSLVGASALLVILGSRKAQHKVVRRPALTEREATGNAVRALGASALWMLLRKRLAQKTVRGHEEKPAVTGLALAATAAKAFLSGARQSEKRGTTRPGKKEAWRGLATTVGSALASYWYSHRGHRV